MTLMRWKNRKVWVLSVSFMDGTAEEYLFERRSEADRERDNLQSEYLPEEIDAIEISEEPEERTIAEATEKTKDP